jgi:hypothetical protein
VKDSTPGAQLTSSKAHQGEFSPDDDFLPGRCFFSPLASSLSAYALFKTLMLG